jgi:hypothetical protein
VARSCSIEERAIIEAVADLSGAAMAQLMERGTFWSRYLRYFRFSDDELERTGDGIHFDHLPKALKPFRKHLFGAPGQTLMNRLGVPRTLARRTTVARRRFAAAARHPARPRRVPARRAVRLLLRRRARCRHRERVADDARARHGHPVRLHPDGVPRSVAGHRASSTCPIDSS